MPNKNKQASMPMNYDIVNNFKYCLEYTYYYKRNTACTNITILKVNIMKKSIRFLPKKPVDHLPCVNTDSCIIFCV